MPWHRNDPCPPDCSSSLMQHLQAALPLHHGMEAVGLHGSRGGFGSQDPTARKAQLDDSPCLLPVPSLSVCFACWKSWHQVFSE